MRVKIGVWVLLTVGCLLVFGVAISSASSPNTYTVTAASGESTGSLSWAIDQANADGVGGDTIKFQANLGTIIAPGGGFPQITASGLTIDGCDSFEQAGGCQAIDATGVDHSAASDAALFDVVASGVTLDGLIVNDISTPDTSPDAYLTLIYDESGAANMTLAYDTLRAGTNLGCCSGTWAIDGEADGLHVGGLDPDSHAPVGAVSVQGTYDPIYIDGNDASIEGDSLTGFAETGIQVGHNGGDFTGVHIAGDVLAGADADYGVYVDGGVLTEVGDPALAAAPNSISGVSTPVKVTSDATSALFYDNTGEAGPDPQQFYDVDASVDGDLQPPAITSATAMSVGGTATPGATVEVLSAGSGPAGATDELDGVLGSTVADSNGNWTVTIANGRLSAGSYVSALQTLPGVGSSANAGAVLVNVPPPPPRYTVAAGIDPATGGNVALSSPDPDASCAGAVCTVNRGDEVDITATPLPGNQFSGWVGACAGQASTTCKLTDVLGDEASAAQFSAGGGTSTAPTGTTTVTVTTTTTTPAATLTPGQQARLLADGSKVARSSKFGGTLDIDGLLYPIKSGGYAVTVASVNGTDFKATPLVIAAPGATTLLAKLEALMSSNTAFNAILSYGYGVAATRVHTNARQGGSGAAQPGDKIELTTAHVIALNAAKGELALGFAKGEVALKVGGHTPAVRTLQIADGSDDSTVPQPLVSLPKPGGTVEMRLSGTSKTSRVTITPDSFSDATGTVHGLEANPITTASALLLGFTQVNTEQVAVATSQADGVSVLAEAPKRTERASLIVTAGANRKLYATYSFSSLDGELRLAGTDAQFDLGFGGVNVKIHNGGTGGTQGASWNRVINTSSDGFSPGSES